MNATFPKTFNYPSAEEIRQLKVHAFFNYDPDINLCYAAVPILALLTLAITFLNIRNRKYGYMFALTMVGSAEIAGYSRRIVMIHDPSLDNMMIMQIFLMLAPNILVLVNFRVIVDVLKMINLKKWAKGLSIAFIVYYIVSFGVQINGIVDFFSSDADVRAQGKTYVLAGTYIQSVFFVCIIVFITQVHRKARDSLPIFVALYFQFTFLFIRAIFRIVSFESDSSADVNRHEYFFVIFDTVIIMAMYVSYIALHYPRYLDKVQKVAPSKDVENK
eukprot:NODE_16_length_49026_cov_1.035992.p15 type:complete len:274 gc:universal NODE_16_length_49026_cov_1.035992:13899-14720(+)